ncbi:MAG TPA: class I SAM-dependent methyltransferase [Thioalkalivibrio sp.]|nr:class I SAM-dependent methyltransferase [Thioalkalivibrio sp.]
MSLRHAYTLWAPVYDLAVGLATREARRASLTRLVPAADAEVLLIGVGTGLDFPFLPTGPRYTGVDLTPAMLARARRRAERHDLAIALEEADAHALPFADQGFDAVVMHLIVAVVPEPERALAEAARVLRPGGRLLILDKFLAPGQRAPVRRAASRMLQHLATRTDVVFEELLTATPSLALIDDRPALAGGWFRHIELEKRA